MPISLHSTGGRSCLIAHEGSRTNGENAHVVDVPLPCFHPHHCYRGGELCNRGILLKAVWMLSLTFQGIYIISATSAAEA